MEYTDTGETRKPVEEFVKGVLGRYEGKIGGIASLNLSRGGGSV